MREAAGGEGVPEKEPGIQNQKQEPHTKLWGTRTPHTKMWGKIDVSSEASVKFHHMSQNATPATEFARCHHLMEP